MAAARVSILGPLEILGPDGPIVVTGRLQRALLVRLALAGGRAVARDRLIDDLWDGEPPASAVNTLQTYVSLLRRALGDTMPLARQGQGYHLQLEPADVDATRFETGLAEGRRLVATDPASAIERLGDALALWRGAALVDAADFAFALGDITRLEELRVVAIEERLGALLALGRHAEAVPELEAAVAGHPLRERLAALLALALYRSGRQADALRAIDRTRAKLADELGLDPTPELVRLEHAILTHDVALEAPVEAPVTHAPPRSPPAVAAPPDAVEPGDAPLALPTAAGRGRRGFFGRTRELAWLHERWEAAVAGSKRLAVLDGEPGIGKTRLAAQLAAEVHAQGALVLWGQCSPEPSTPYQPVTEGLRDVGRLLAPDALAAMVHTRPALSRLLPVDSMVRVGAPDPGGGAAGAGSPDTDPGAARYHLFEAVASLVAEVSRANPVLFVIDDIHWADVGTMAMIGHVLRHPDPGALCVLGTARSVDVGGVGAFRDAVADLRRDRLIDRLSLGGLDPAATAELVTAVSSDLAGRAAEVHRATAGNAFFVEELAAHLAETDEPAPTTAPHEDPGELEPVPASVREVVLRRLERLGPDTMAVLSATAVLGDEVELDVLEAVAGPDADELLDLVDSARDAGLLAEDPDELGRYRFVHALVRSTLLERMSRTRIARLHLHAAEAFEAGRGQAAVRAREIAYHRLAALPAGDPITAVRAALDAARTALDDLAYETALDLATRAHAVFDARGDGDPRTTAEIQLVRGAALRTVGRLAEARIAYDEAAVCSRLNGFDDILVSAALAASAAKAGGMGFDLEELDEPLVALIDDALATNPPDAARVRLLGALAVTLAPTAQWERPDALSGEAVDLASKLGDPRLLGAALESRGTLLWRPPRVPERYRLMAEAADLADQTGDADLAVRARVGLISALLELARVPEAEAEIDRLDTLVHRLSQPAYAFFPRSYRVLLNLLRGEYAEAEAGATAVHAMTHPLYGSNTQAVYDARRYLLVRDQQGLAALIDPNVAPDADSTLPIVRLTSAHVFALAGHPDAPAMYEAIADQPVRNDVLWTVSMAILCELAHLHRDRVRARPLLERLEPFAGRLVCSGMAISNGMVTRYLGLAAQALGDLDCADRWFARSVAEHEAIGARPWLARSLQGQADVLAERRAPGDVRRADALRSRAEAIAAEIGLVLTDP